MNVARDTAEINVSFKAHTKKRQGLSPKLPWCESFCVQSYHVVTTNANLHHYFHCVESRRMCTLRKCFLVDILLTWPRCDEQTLPELVALTEKVQTADFLSAGYASTSCWRCPCTSALNCATSAASISSISSGGMGIFSCPLTLTSAG